MRLMLECWGEGSRRMKCIGWRSSILILLLGSAFLVARATSSHAQPTAANGLEGPPAVQLQARRHDGQCTPGYDPCIPPGPDVDCAGGRGDGPRYIEGPVYVSGSDPYDLDRDRDGIGCERRR